MWCWHSVITLIYCVWLGSVGSWKSALFRTSYTDVILSKSNCSSKEMQKIVYELDRIIKAKKCLEKTPLIVKVMECVGWTQLWDADKTQDRRRERSADGEQSMSHQCHYFFDVVPLSEASVLEHIQVAHLEQLHLDLKLSFLDNLHKFNSEIQ